MKLIMEELKKRFKEVGDQSELQDPVVIAKFFDPVGSVTWYATEYEPERNVCHGYVTGLAYDEWGSFSIDELESIKRPLGLCIERDIYAKERPISTFIKRNRLTELEDIPKDNQQNQEVER